MKSARIDLAPEKGMLRSAKSCGIALSVLLLMQSGCSCGCSHGGGGRPFAAGEATTELRQVPLIATVDKSAIIRPIPLSP